jgi:hypothetical protein
MVVELLMLHFPRLVQGSRRRLIKVIGCHLLLLTPRVLVSFDLERLNISQHVNHVDQKMKD